VSEKCFTADLTVCSISYMPKRRKVSESMTAALRRAIAESDLSFKQLEKETGVIRQSLMKFAAGEQSIRLESADKLARFFGIEVMRRKRK